VKQDRCTEAARAYRKASELKPDSTPHMLATAQALQKEGKYAKAEIFLLRILDQDPLHAATWSQLVDLLRSQGRQVEADKAHALAAKAARTPGVEANRFREELLLPAGFVPGVKMRSCRNGHEFAPSTGFEFCPRCGHPLE
jgi:tetratricopeptide (TPR) repeat protein